MTADLTPTQAARLDPTTVLGIVTAAGSPLSHGAILARSLGIPAVVGAGLDVLAIPDGITFIVDGTDGVVVIDPDPTVWEPTTAIERRRHRRHADTLPKAAIRPAVTFDGVSDRGARQCRVCATTPSKPYDMARTAWGSAAHGVPPLDRPDPPGEDEQLDAYLSLADALQGRRLTVRTLDVGGDKPVPYLPAGTEENPFLGRRGLRLSLQQPDLFKQQLRVFDPSRPPASRHGAVPDGHDDRGAPPRPAVCSTKRLSRSAAGTATSRHNSKSVPWSKYRPSWLHALPAAVPLVDLMSIGTNDLTQYTLAAERGNAGVAALADPLDPAVLYLISEVADAATARARVAVCGELAADPVAAALLIGLGVRELSMTPRAIPAVKDAVRSMSANKAKQLAALALHRDSAASVRALLSDLA